MFVNGYIIEVFVKIDLVWIVQNNVWMGIFYWFGVCSVVIGVLWLGDVDQGDIMVMFVFFNLMEFQWEVILIDNIENLVCWFGGVLVG